MRELDRNGSPVTFATVAHTAGVSRSWPYGEEDLREEIVRLREATRPTSARPVPSLNAHRTVHYWMSATLTARQGPDRVDGLYRTDPGATRLQLVATAGVGERIEEFAALPDGSALIYIAVYEHLTIVERRRSAAGPLATSLADGWSPLPTNRDVAFAHCGIHAAIVAPSVARTVRSERQVDPLTVLASATRDDIAADPVLTAIVERRERRRMAREIVSRDPALADELGIGQPGRDDRFDDGGLIDVNRVDVAVLATLPGFDHNMAVRVVAARDRFEGLRSIADLVVDADVPTDVADHLADRLLFRPLDDVRSD